MFITIHMFVFAFFLLIFSFMAISFSSLFITWGFMELNLLLVVPLLLINSSASKEQPSLVLKYFLVQVMGSIILLSAISFSNNSGLVMSSAELLLLVALMLKAGMPPLHFWFPKVMYMANPPQGFILMCVQKVIPLFLLSTLISEMILLFIISASFLGSVAGLNQNSMMKVLAYSSMVHSSWIVSGMVIMASSAYLYFLVYCYVSSVILLTISAEKIKFISEFTSFKSPPLMKLAFILSVFTLSGAPPFIGFFMKSYIILCLMSHLNFMVVVFLVLGSSVSFFFYTRMIISLSLLNLKSSKEKKVSTASTVVVFMLTSISLMFLMILWTLA